MEFQELLDDCKTSIHPRSQNLSNNKDWPYYATQRDNWCDAGGVLVFLPISRRQSRWRWNIVFLPSSRPIGCGWRIAFGWLVGGACCSNNGQLDMQPGALGPHHQPTFDNPKDFPRNSSSVWGWDGLQSETLYCSAMLMLVLTLVNFWQLGNQLWPRCLHLGYWLPAQISYWGIHPSWINICKLYSQACLPRSTSEMPAGNMMNQI